MDVEPTKKLDLTPEDLQLQDVDQRKDFIESRQKTVKMALRKVRLNIDIAVLLICCAACVGLGYSIHGLFSTPVVEATSKALETADTGSSIMDVIILFIITIFSFFAKLAANKGFLSEKFSRKITEMLNDIFKGKDEIDKDSYTTIVQDAHYKR